MKTFAIKANSNDENKIFANYLDGHLKSSFLFRGCGKLNDTVFYVTHGEDGEEGGYYVLDCSGLRKRRYSQDEFAFYMNGLMEYNPAFSGVTNIVTIECFGGYHHPSILQMGRKEIPMRPLSPEKAVLWAGWRKIDGSLFFICVAFSEHEYEALESNGMIEQSVNEVISKTMKVIDANADYQEWAL